MWKPPLLTIVHEVGEVDLPHLLGEMMPGGPFESELLVMVLAQELKLAIVGRQPVAHEWDEDVRLLDQPNSVLLRKLTKLTRNAPWPGEASLQVPLRIFARVVLEDPFAPLHGEEEEALLWEKNTLIQPDSIEPSGGCLLTQQIVVSRSHYRRHTIDRVVEEWEWVVFQVLLPLRSSQVVLRHELGVENFGLFTDCVRGQVDGAGGAGICPGLGTLPSTKVVTNADADAEKNQSKPIDWHGTILSPTNEI